MEALHQLEPKKTLAAFDYEPVATIDDILGYATIVYNADNPVAKSMLSPIFDEFSHRSEFQMFGFGTDSTQFDSSENTIQWRMINEAYPFDKDLAIIDTSGTIRNYYLLDSVSFTSLGQHIPIIIPRKKEKDIVLKRDDEI